VRTAHRSALTVLRRIIAQPTASEVSVDSSARRICAISREADFSHDLFLTRIELVEDASGWAQSAPLLRDAPGAHMLRFSPDGRELAVVVSAGEGEEKEHVVVIDLDTGDRRIVADAPAATARIAWALDGRGVFVASTVASATGPAQLADTIPARLPWNGSLSELRYVPVRSGPIEPAVIARVAGEIDHIVVSADGASLGYTELACRARCFGEHRLVLVDCRAPHRRTEILLPTPVVSSLTLSPANEYAAYVGGRRPWLDGACLTPLPAEEDCRRDRAVNGYDCRVCVVDLARGQAWLLSAQAELTAGVPVGLAPTADEIHWHDDATVTYVATVGHRTALASQRIDDDATLELQPLGDGSSRSHSFAADGSGVCLHSERGEQFAVARWSSHRMLRLVRRGRPSQQAPTCPTVRPTQVDHIPAAGAWLYLPPATSADTCRLVVHVYGGATPLTLAYDETQQALVACGYAVLVVNPSGCAGYGREVADRHVDDWGDHAIAEVIATTDQVLARHPRLCDQRVGLYGGSYGGFVAMRIVAHTDAFAAVVSLAGISNVASYWAGSRTGFEYGAISGGRTRPWSHPQLYLERSPLFAADDITTPLLLLHGECDGVVPVEESRQMLVALATLDRPVAMVTMADEDHAMRSRPSSRLIHQRYLMAWFDRFLRDDDRSWTAVARDARLPGGGTPTAP
jgi:dipeptidyl aminopeptidase/acylaminoacyl peptidase